MVLPQWQGLAVIAIMALDYVVAIPSLQQHRRFTGASHSAQENASISEHFLLGRDDEFDDTDLSFIKKMAAIGDSYSAGIGAGGRLGSVFDLLTQGSGRSTFKHLPDVLLSDVYTDAPFG